MSDDDGDLELELLEADEKMEKAVGVLRDDFATVRTGRPTPSMFAKIMVNYYGTYTPVQQLASFNVPEPRMVLVSPYDKGSLVAVEKAIRESDLGVNPSNDGSLIRCVFPELSEQRRRELVKVVRGKAEDAKISVRNLRRKAKDELDALKSEVGDDDVARGEKELEQITKTHVDAIDTALKHKEAELLEI